MNILTLRWLIATWCAAILTACGGSSNNNTPAAPPPPSLEGAYWMAMALANATAGNTNASWGTITLSAGGSGSVTGSNNLNGTVSPIPATAATHNYAPEPSRDMAVTVNGATFNGRLSPNGEVFAASSTTAGLDPNLMVCVRKGGTHSLASSTGSYAMVLYTPGVNLFTGTITLDGTGTATVSGSVNDGVTAPGPIGDTIGYALGADGALSFMAAGDLLVGGISPSGEVMVLGGDASDPGPAFICVCIRQSGSGMSNASLMGDYAWRSLGSDAAGPTVYAWGGSAISDGTNSLNLTGQENRDGMYSAFSAPHTYNVNASGRFTLSGSGEDFLGHLSADGGFAVLAGPTNVTGQPRVAAMVR